MIMWVVTIRSSKHYLLENFIPLCIQNVSNLCDITLFERMDTSYVIPRTIDIVLELINFLVPKMQSATLYNNLIKGS